MVLHDYERLGPRTLACAFADLSNAGRPAGGLNPRLAIPERELARGPRIKPFDAGGQLLFRATHDSLTGAANRGVILDTLRRERSRQSRDGGSFGIVLADLDHFKICYAKRPSG
ncbi:MAG TPA: diguanylate cyclase [Candidatus Acidoferrales bacterium]|jgi:hypothetical protein|nr:diguanylate cyclase [Candidatus Acidoferrales bacterium]